MAGSIPASPTADARRALLRRWRRGLAALPPPPAGRGQRRCCSLVLVAAVVLGPLLWRMPINEIDFSAHARRARRWRIRSAPTISARTCSRACSTAAASRWRSGFAAMGVAVLVGTLIGALAGMSRGAVDAALMWLTDLFLSLPQLPLLLLLIYLFREPLKAVFGPEGGVFILIVLVIGGFRWMPVARLVRAQFLSLREKEFVEAARALGASPVRAGGAPHPAQRARAGDRRRHHRRRRRHHRRVDAVVPRPRLSARHPDLGPAAVRRQGLPRHRRRTGRCFPAARSSWPCWPSTSSATGCATRSIRAAGDADGAAARDQAA